MFTPRLVISAAFVRHSRSSNQFVRACSNAVINNATKKEHQLMREWIRDSLYNPEIGYFMRSADIIRNTANKKFDFSNVPALQGREEYIQGVSKWFRYIDKMLILFKINHKKKTGTKW